MKKVKPSYGCFGETNTVNLRDTAMLSNLYFNTKIADDIETFNGCVILKEETLVDIIKNAFTEGWRSSDAYRNQFITTESSEKKQYVNYKLLENELKKKHFDDSFSSVVFYTPFKTKEYMMKENNMSENTWNNLPEYVKSEYNETYVKGPNQYEES